MRGRGLLVQAEAKFDPMQVKATERLEGKGRKEPGKVKKECGKKKFHSRDRVKAVSLGESQAPVTARR